MAAVLVAPQASTKGVLTFTTQERDKVILQDPRVQEQVLRLKEHWVIGLHHNWHDYNFAYNPLFDFSMAGEGDLREKDGRAFPCIPMDACNFVPDCFTPSAGEKFWDILCVARAVRLKGIPEFFASVRRLYDAGSCYRILFICPVPPYQKSEEKTVLYNIRAIYDAMFSQEEQDLFTLLTIEYRYPFPFDLETLAYFYRSARVFVQPAPDERRSRVAAYAWASGIPVVGMESIGSVLPKSLSTEPYFWQVSDYDALADCIAAAVENCRRGAANFEPVQREVSARFTVASLQARLASLFHQLDLSFDDSSSAYSGLDIRLGRHHGISVGQNNLEPALPRFLDCIEEQPTLASAICGFADPERELEKRIALPPRSSIRSRLGRLLAPR